MTSRTMTDLEVLQAEYPHQEYTQEQADLIREQNPEWMDRIRREHFHKIDLWDCWNDPKCRRGRRGI